MSISQVGSADRVSPVTAESPAKRAGRFAVCSRAFHLSLNRRASIIMARCLIIRRVWWLSVLWAHC